MRTLSYRKEAGYLSSIHHVPRMVAFFYPYLEGIGCFPCAENAGSWSSLRFQELSDPMPVELLRDWLHWIDRSLFEHELTALRTCVNRRQAFGTDNWRTTTAVALGMESTLRSRGRPIKHLAK